MERGSVACPATRWTCPANQMDERAWAKIFKKKTFRQFEAYEPRPKAFSMDIVAKWGEKARFCVAVQGGG